MKREEIPRASLFTLLRTFTQGSWKLTKLESGYIMDEAPPQLKRMSVWLVFILLGLGFATVGCTLMIVTTILILNIWLMPWASALVVMLGFFGLGGLCLLIGLIKAKLNWDDLKTLFGILGKDLRWLVRK